MIGNHKSRWMHKTVDINKENGCQICSLKIDLAVGMNDVKKKKINKRTLGFLVYSQY